MDTKENPLSLKDNQNYSNPKKIFYSQHFDLPRLQQDKLCLFASYSFTEEVAEYVLHYLAEIKKEDYVIIFISTSVLKPTSVNKLQQYCAGIFERENKGLDFASWQLALQECNWGLGYKEILLANDSVFGPLVPLGPIIKSMNKRFDVWGMSDNYEINYHLQSYFLHFSERVIKGTAWLNFWQGVDANLPKDEIIKKYEVGLSKYFTDAGFRLGAYASTDTVLKSEGDCDKNINASLLYWKPLIEKFDFPFLKRELLIKPTVTNLYWHKKVYFNTHNWRKVIADNTGYPVALVDGFLQQYFEVITNANSDVVLKKKKLIFISHNAAIGGAQKVLIYFLQWLKKNTDIPFEVIVAHSTEKEELLDDMLSVCAVTRFWALSEGERKALKDRLATEYIGLIFSNTMVNVEVQQFLSFLRVPQITFVHELPYVISCFPFIETNKEWINQNVNHFIACANAVKKELKPYLDIEEKRLIVIHGFIEPVKSRTPSNKLASLKQQYHIPEDTFVVGMSGTFEWRKSADLIPHLAKILCHPDNKIHIVWLGAEMESALYKTLLLDITKAGLEKRVHLIPKQKDPNMYYDLFDVFLMPSREDPFPLVNLENGLRGTPVICFDNSGGSPEYVALGTGTTVPYLDLCAMCNAVFELYQNKTKAFEQKAEIASIARENFLIDVQAPKLLKVIKQYYNENELIPVEQPSIAIMTHLFYDNTWSDIKRKLVAFKELNTKFFFSVSEDCLAKDEIVEDIQLTFPDAFVLTTSNLGKDIGGKMALLDLYLTLGVKSEFIIFLHDKQSPQTLVGEEWKNNLHKIVDVRNYKLVVDLFKEDPKIGIVGAKEHIIDEYDHTKNTFIHNNELVPVFLNRYNIKIKNYEYLSGTMYWMRAKILENFFSQNNPMKLRAELEAGNVLDNHGSTYAHTWERMFCWISTNQGFKLKGF